nr:TetR/AcrR family transcriptional regulator [Sedimentibacter sp.]
MKYENETKKRIRKTALEFFNKRSFDKVTINEICKACNINKHTFYYYFKSKDELLNNYYEIPSNIKTSDINELINTESYVEQLWLTNKNFIDFIENSGEHVIKQIIIKNLTDDIGTFKFSDKKKELFKLQESIIKKGQDNLQIMNKTEPRILVITYWQLMHYIVIIWSSKKGNFYFSDAARYVFERLFDVAPKYVKIKSNYFSDIFE